MDFLGFLPLRNNRGHFDGQAMLKYLTVNIYQEDPSGIISSSVLKCYQRGHHHKKLTPINRIWGQHKWQELKLSISDTLRWGHLDGQTIMKFWHSLRSLGLDDNNVCWTYHHSPWLYFQYIISNCVLVNHQFASPKCVDQLSHNEWLHYSSETIW